jgi:tetratricopeptide (TPR) repeat protein
VKVRRREHLRIEALERVRSASHSENAAEREAALMSGVQLYREYLDFAENRDDDEAWAGLGGAYRRLGDVDSAIDCYETAYSHNAQSTYALVNLVCLHAASGRADRDRLAEYATRAQEMLRNRIRDGTADHWTWYDMATLELILGHTERAVETFNFAIERTPRDAKENFASVLANLKFLNARNPDLAGLSQAIGLVERHTKASGKTQD